ncbi:MAG: biotin--[acetyl-CoA-carboxylase] ligase [Paracoccaceae bacterium]
MSTEATAIPPWPAGTGRILLDETDSTMAEARRRMGGLDAPTWILARHQTGAQGRRGRPWAHPPGNFAATLAMRTGGGPAAAALRSFTAALALHDTLSALTDPADLALKWPNDVLLCGRKVAGILLETGGAAGRADWLSIGIGVNLVAAPPPEAVEPGATPPVSVAAVGGRAEDPVEVLGRLAGAFDAWEGRFRAYGFAPVRAAWLDRAARLGETITARTMTETLQGRFETVDDTGQLVLLTPQGRRVIPAAEVFF